MAYQPKSYRKFVATAATATLVASAIAPVAGAASNFTDVAPKYKDAVDYLVANNITKGATATTFGTHDNIKRGDLAIWLAAALKLDTTGAAASGFVDTKGTRYDAAVSVLKSKGYINGKTATEFAPSAPVTRGEMAIMLSNAYDLKSDTATKFTDAVGNYKNAIQGLFAYGVTTGKSETMFGTSMNITRGDLAIFLKRAAEVVKTPAVVSVEAVNGKELVVKFNQAVSEAEAETSTNYKLNGVAIGTPELSEDGKTVTITTSSVISANNATLEVASIPTKADKEKTTVKYVTLFSYTDTLAPSVAKVEAQGGKAVVTFAEDLNGNPGVSVNGATYTDFTVSGKTLTINNLTNEKTYSVEVVGAKDAAGNLANPISLNFTVAKPDVALPQAVTTSVKENKVTLQFVNAISSSNTASVLFKDGKAYNTTALTLTGMDTTGVKYSADKKSVTLDAQALGVLTGLNFLTTDIEVAWSGLTTPAKTTATLTADKTAAKVVSSQTTAAGKLVLEFDEEVKNPGSVDLKVTAVNDIYQSTPQTWSSLAVAYAKDAKGNDVTTKLEVSLPSTVVVGTKYTVEVPATVTDLYNNATAKFTTSVVKPATDNTVKPGQVITVDTDVKKNVIKLTFGATKEDKGVTTSATTLSNYTLGGKALPSGTEVRYVDNKNNVEIVLPANSIQTTGVYVLELKNIVDEAGNTLKAEELKQEVSLVENVAPVATSLTIKSSSEAVVNFSEAVAYKDLTATGYATNVVDGITVKVNGQPVAVTFTSTDVAGSTLSIKGLDLKATDAVSVEFKNAELFDGSVNANQVTDKVVTK